MCSRGSVAASASRAGFTVAAVPPHTRGHHTCVVEGIACRRARASSANPVTGPLVPREIRTRCGASRSRAIHAGSASASAVEAPTRVAVRIVPPNPRAGATAA